MSASTHPLDACELCGRAGGARRPGYDFLVCARCAVPEPQGAMLGRNPTVAGEGAEPWYFRPFRWMRGQDGVVTWDQPAPPTHCKGSPPKLRGGKSGCTATPTALLRAQDELAAAGCTIAEQEVILLQAQGLTRAQMALRLQLTEEGVKDRLKRAHKRIRERAA